MAGGQNDRRNEDGLIIWVLGTSLVLSILLIGAIQIFGSPNANTSFFEVLASSMAGALAGRITSTRAGGRSDDEDDMAVIGREATRRVVSEALRGLSDHGDEMTKNPVSRNRKP